VKQQLRDNLITKFTSNGDSIMKRNSKIFFMILFLASVGRAQVVLPPSSEYNDPYNYYRDCVSNNGQESETVCEQQTGSLFPEEDSKSVEEPTAQVEESPFDPFSMAIADGE
jgi:hypothetical protein